MTDRRSRVYEARVTFDAPVDFAFRWCTDYDGGDARLEGEKYTREVFARSKRQVVYEDVERTRKGWVWSHSKVTLHPPNHWHADVVGNYRSWSLDYRLRPLGAERTEFYLRGRRSPSGIGGSNPSKATLEAHLTSMWKKFGRALARDYRRDSRKGRAGRSSRD